MKLLPFFLLAALPLHAEPVALSDGQSFAGWEGDTAKTWRLVDGAFVGGSLAEKVPHNEFLASQKSYKDFELRLKFRLLGSEGMINGGVQFRSERIPNHFEMKGYQADLGGGYWGTLYDESRRNKALAGPAKEAIASFLKPGEWNEYRIRCEGPRIQLWINGVQTVDYTEPDASIVQEGKLGLQVHGGGKVEAWYKDLVIEELPGQPTK
jgi:hypothetical protein